MPDHAGTDRAGDVTGRSRHRGWRGVPEARRHRGYVLSLEENVPGLDLHEMRDLRQLRDENRRLKHNRRMHIDAPASSKLDSSAHETRNEAGGNSGDKAVGEMRRWLTDPASWVPSQSRRLCGINRQQMPQVRRDAGKVIR